VSGPAGLPAGTEVVVVVRPENLRAAPAENRHGLTATVVDASFQGAVRTVRLQAAGLGELTAAAGGAGQAPAPGSTVSLTWDDDHAWLISTGDGTP
jgi:ABC-type Fe3+/spermidine/putrescine transport system ATPase subunit